MIIITGLALKVRCNSTRAIPMHVKVDMIPNVSVKVYALNSTYGSKSVVKER